MMLMDGGVHCSDYLALSCCNCLVRGCIRAAHASGWMAVAALFPMFMVSVVIIRSVILFKRVAIRDKEGFNRMIDRMMEQSPVNGLNVYPEGHRSTAAVSLPLRRGMLHFAYSRKMPVQIVMTAGKEAVISEKDMAAHFGQTLLVGYSQKLDPEDYSSTELFCGAVQDTWCREWRRVRDSDWGQAIPFQTGGVDFAVHYTLRIKLLSIVSQGLSLACFFGTLYASWQAATWMLSSFGSHGRVAALTVIIWAAVSVADASRIMSPSSRQAGQQLLNMRSSALDSGETASVASKGSSSEQVLPIQTAHSSMAIRRG